MSGNANPPPTLTQTRSISGQGKSFLLTRKGKGSFANATNQKIPNTYQLSPSKDFAFSSHRVEIREIVQTALDEALGSEQSDLKEVLSDILTRIRVEVLQLQPIFFPRHRLVVHGMIGAVTKHPPSLIYGTQCLAEQECGDDGVSVSVMNYERFICVSVFGVYQS